MTTSSNPTPTTTESEDSSSELSRIWRAIGRLEGTVNALLEGQRELKEGQQELKEGQQEIKESQERVKQELRDEFKADLREVHRRMDRMFFAFIAIGGALLVSVYASRFIGG